MMNYDEFFTFLNNSWTSTRAAANISALLEAEGFRPLPSSRRGDAQTGTQTKDGQRFFLQDGGSIIAIASGRSGIGTKGLLLLGAHTDSPGLRLKQRGASRNDGLIRVPVEVYGSPILASWIDRDLAVVGRIAVATDAGTSIHEIDTRTPLATIPNVAIHLNRTVNDSASYDRHQHLPLLFGPGKRSESDLSPLEALYGIVAPNIPYDKILDAELMAVPSQSATLLGERLVCSDRLDNLVGCYSNLDAIRRCRDTETTVVLACVDHEEIGSVSATGAAGNWIERGIRRLLAATGVERDQADEIVRRSVLISNDAAHARHPNYSEKHDPAYAPLLCGGPVLKQSAVLRYASGLPARAWLTSIAKSKNLPLQYLQNRADIPAGSTIGPAIASRMAVSSVDIGVPLLAMHSARETVCLDDIDSTAALLAATIERGIDEVSDAY